MNFETGKENVLKIYRKLLCAVCAACLILFGCTGYAARKPKNADPNKSADQTASVEKNAAAAPAIDVTLGQAHRGTPEIDMDLLNSYSVQPESVRGFFAAAREGFEADKKVCFAGNSALQAAAVKYGVNHLGGPLLGNVGPEQASVWIRTVKPAGVVVKVTGPAGTKEFGPVSSLADTDLTAVVPLTGLKPATEYSYQIFIDGRLLELEQKTTFTTFPSYDSKGTFQFAFGADFHKSGVHNIHLLRQVRQRHNQAMVLIGDSAVDDRNNQTGLHRSDYLLRDLSPAWQALAAAVPIYAAWDDHDYFDNDLSGIPAGFTAEDVRAVREVWIQNWNNPAAGADGEGIYFRTRIGPADMIILDTRSLRKKTPGQPNAFLGDKQTDWLKQQLLQCKGPFVIISSGTMWSDSISNGKDSWGVWDPNGRDSLFSFIEKNHIPGVLLITGDRHGARGFKIPRPSGYHFYEFEVGALGGMKGPPASAKKGVASQLFGQTNIKAFGEFAFNTQVTDPRVTFRLVDETGVVLEEISLLKSEISP
ncbi:MAG: alkaline phosphatase family protein [Planctomycetes bacterium]|nr:alkaline phosphatase family protein [Planctomycetota bacterium]